MENENFIRIYSLEIDYDGDKKDCFICAQKNGRAKFLLLNNNYYPIKFFLSIKIHPSRKSELGMEAKYYDEKLKEKSYEPRNGMFVILSNKHLTERLGKIENLIFIESVKKAA